MMREARRVCLPKLEVALGNNFVRLKNCVFFQVCKEFLLSLLLTGNGNP